MNKQLKHVNIFIKISNTNSKILHSFNIILKFLTIACSLQCSNCKIEIRFIRDNSDILLTSNFLENLRRLYFLKTLVKCFSYYVTHFVIRVIIF